MVLLAALLKLLLSRKQRADRGPVNDSEFKNKQDGHIDTIATISSSVQGGYTKPTPKGSEHALWCEKKMILPLIF